MCFIEDAESCDWISVWGTAISIHRRVHVVRSTYATLPTISKSCWPEISMYNCDLSTKFFKQKNDIVTEFYVPRIALVERGQEHYGAK